MKREYPARRAHRLPDYDYSQNGYYFITICTHQKAPILTSGINFQPTAAGIAVLRAWDTLSHLDANVRTDAFCLMPNHIHGIVILQNQPPEIGAAPGHTRRSLPELVRGLKSTATRLWRQAETDAGQLWQASYYDEIIRNFEMLQHIRRYIVDNPAKWLEDAYYTPYKGLRERPADGNRTI